jgi:hypothetical protein
MLSHIFRKHKWPIGLTYLVFAIEFTLFAMLPYLLGLAVDGMLEHRTGLFKTYVAVCGVGMLIGFGRRRMDTRVFANIWAGHTANAVERLLERDVEPSSIVSRSGYVRTYADFFEYSLPTIFSSLTNIVISVVMVWLAATVGGIAALAATILAISICYHFACRIQAVDLEMQEVREGIDARIIQKDAQGVGVGYEEYRRLYIRHSDLDATNWGLMDFLSIGCEIVVMLAVVSNGHTVGTIMATLSYTTRIFQRIEFVSSFFNVWKQLEIADQLLHHED